MVKIHKKKNPPIKKRKVIKSSKRSSTSILTRSSRTKVNKLSKIKNYIMRNKIKTSAGVITGLAGLKVAYEVNKLRKNPHFQNLFSQIKTAIVRRSPITKAIFGELFADSYELIKIIGSGSFGSAFLAKDKKSGSTVIIKKMEVPPANRRLELEYLQNEIEILQKLASLKNNTYTTKYITHKYHKNNIYIVFSYDYPDTLEKLRKDNNLNQTLKDNIFIQTIKGLKFLHSNNITHNDIKEDNIIVDHSTGNIKYIDFGLACNISCIFRPGIGGFVSHPPEIIKRNIEPTVSGKMKLEDSKRADVWGLGVTLYTLLYNKHPYLPKRYYATYTTTSSDTEGDTDQIVLQKMKFIEYNNSVVDSKHNNILKQMLELDPKKRITMDKIHLSGIIPKSSRGFFGLW